MTARRSYDSPVRRQGMEATRERIVNAGVELVRALDTWDWSSVTFRAVAERAGVGERTVYRHFPTERALRDAIMAGLARAAGVDYESVTLSTVAETAGQVFRSLASVAPTPTHELALDPALVEADRQRRDALLRAVAADRPALSDAERVRLAAALDVLWGVESYERLVDRWGMEPDEATGVLAWMIGLLVDS